MIRLYTIVCLLIGISIESQAQISKKLQQQLEESAKQVEGKVISWRRDFHQHPELSNREFKTGKKIADYLTSLGLEVKYPVAKTGVVAVLRTGKPGPTVALRADMDGLPVKERVNVPFASKEISSYKGEETPVMHACGHDTHMAILLGTAEVLTKMKSTLKGNIVFLFQPAEEGAPEGEEGGAALMIKEGVLDNPKVDVAFGLHISSQIPVGVIAYRPKGIMAAVDELRIKVHGKGAHGSTPWAGVDPVVTSAQIINGLQTVVSRRLNLTKGAAVVTVSTIKGGLRHNIIPEEVEMGGTLRTLDSDMRKTMHTKIRETVDNIAASMGAKADVEIIEGYPVTYNSPELTNWAKPVLEHAAGQGRAIVIEPITGAEDFSYFAQKVPGLFFFLGGMPAGVKTEDAPSHHTPDFYVDDSGLVLGVRAMLSLTANYLYNPMTGGKK